MPPASAASAGIAFFTSADAATSACRVMAPMVTALPSTLMPRSSAIAPRSTRSDGRDRRSFIAAIRLCPPASSLASAFLAMTAAASATDLARWYLNEYMLISS